MFIFYLPPPLPFPTLLPSRLHSPLTFLQSSYSHVGTAGSKGELAPFSWLILSPYLPLWKSDTLPSFHLWPQQLLPPSQENFQRKMHQSPPQCPQGARIPQQVIHSTPTSPGIWLLDGSGTHALACPLPPLLLLPENLEARLKEEESQCDMVEGALECSWGDLGPRLSLATGHPCPWVNSLL